MTDEVPGETAVTLRMPSEFSDRVDKIVAKRRERDPLAKHSRNAVLLKLLDRAMKEEERER